MQFSACTQVPRASAQETLELTDGAVHWKNWYACSKSLKADSDQQHITPAAAHLWSPRAHCVKQQGLLMSAATAAS